MTATAPAHVSTSPTPRTPANTSARAVGHTIPRPTSLRIQGRQTVLRSIRAEWIKIWSLRSTWVTSFIAIALTVLFGVGVVISYAHTAGEEAEAAHKITSGTSFGQIAVAVLGALIITGEYASGQIRSSLAAVPHRGRLLLSKAVVLAVISFILGSVSVFLAWAISKPFIGEHARSLTDFHYAGYIWGSGLTFVGIALMTLGIGFLLRSTAGAITVVVSLLFVVSVPLYLAAGKWDWANKVIGCLPSTVSGAVSDPFHLSTQWGGDAVQFLTQGQAIAVFVAWAIVPLSAAWFVFSRRDA